MNAAVAAALFLFLMQNRIRIGGELRLCGKMVVSERTARRLHDVVVQA